MADSIDKRSVNTPEPTVKKPKIIGSIMLVLMDDDDVAVALNPIKLEPREPILIDDLKLVQKLSQVIARVMNSIIEMTDMATTDS